MPTPRVLAPLVAFGLALGGAAAVGTASPVTAAAEFDPLDAPQRIADTRPAGETVDDQFEGAGK